MSCVYISITLEKRALTIEEAIGVVRGQYSSTEEVPVEKELVIRLSTTPQHMDEVTKTNSNGSYTDVEFTEEASDRGFGCPYEDIVL
ncbi:MAG: hypothetical protein II832_07695 [Synergistaceae bacterium]|nr:hypothetical protein [Synergistaceae bacterium]MBQ6971561.1 hypothetical protein [Synergistaceae bacterium]